MKNIPPFKVPEGYGWCEDCKALTPFTKEQFKRYCNICMNTKYGYGCNNCGWEEPDNGELLVKEVSIHGDGCHCDNYDPYQEDGYYYDNWATAILKDFFKSYPNHLYNYNQDRNKIEKRLKELNLLECSCPKVTIYPVTNIYNFREYSVFSMDCSNAIEWSYDVRCPICGDIFYVQDGNC